jgi:hypothetical protein
MLVLVCTWDPYVSVGVHMGPCVTVLVCTWDPYVSVGVHMGSLC